LEVQLAQDRAGQVQRVDEAAPRIAPVREIQDIRVRVVRDAEDVADIVAVDDGANVDGTQNAPREERLGHREVETNPFAPHHHALRTGAKEIVIGEVGAPSCSSRNENKMRTGFWRDSWNTPNRARPRRTA
jgi:hypothetical protein